MTGRDSKPSAASHVSCPVDDLSASLSGLSIQYGHGALPVSYLSICSMLTSYFEAGDATSSGNARQDDEAGSQYRCVFWSVPGSIKSHIMIFFFLGCESPWTARTLTCSILSKYA